MRFPLALSLFANVLLCAVVIFLVRHHDQPSPAGPQPNKSVNALQAMLARPTEPARTTPTAAPPPSNSPDDFRWSTIESADYRNYVANLRHIGCPEQTIRDLLLADIDAAQFAVRKQELEQHVFNSEPNDSTTRRVATAELKQLRSQETALVASLMESESASATAALAATRHLPVQSSLAMTPIAFRSLDPARANLTSQELQFISAARESFVDALGGPNQDPSAPGYRLRWLQAERDANQELRGMLGRRRYQQLEQQTQALDSNPQN